MESTFETITVVKPATYEGVSMASASVNAENTEMGYIVVGTPSPVPSSAASESTTADEHRGEHDTVQGQRGLLMSCKIEMLERNAMAF